MHTLRHLGHGCVASTSTVKLYLNVLVNILLRIKASSYCSLLLRALIHKRKDKQKKNDKMSVFNLRRKQIKNSQDLNEIK